MSGEKSHLKIYAKKYKIASNMVNVEKFTKKKIIIFFDKVAITRIDYNN